MCIGMVTLPGVIHITSGATSLVGVKTLEIMRKKVGFVAWT